MVCSCVYCVAGLVQLERGAVLDWSVHNAVGWRGSALAWRALQLGCCSASMVNAVCGAVGWRGSAQAWSALFLGAW